MIHALIPCLIAVALLAVALRRLVPEKWRWQVILAASLFSLAWTDWKYALTLIPVLLGFWGLARWMDRETGDRKKRLLITALTAVLALLAIYKYTPLFNRAGNLVLELAGREPAFSSKNLILPVGISYYAFRLIHYLVERYRDRTPALPPGRFLLYLIFFPTFVAGPIERSERFTEVRDKDEAAAVREAVRRIVFGLFKSLVIGAALARWCLPALRSPDLHSSSALVLAVYALSFYIYYDFAGYSDIAIGASRLLGYRIMENFDRPYLSASPADFWRRWHMSMSFFLRDYVYIPLGGSRAGRGRHYLNYLIVMAVCGMWHGSAGHFVVWGAIHGVGLMAANLVQQSLRRRPAGSTRTARLRRWAGTAVTFNFVAAGWVFFFFDVDQALYILYRIGGGGP